jgi:hypothetical protein
MKYIDEPLVDLDAPDPAAPAPRTLRPRYLDTDPEIVPERPRIPSSAHGLPAYRFTLPPRTRPLTGGAVYLAPHNYPRAPLPGPLANFGVDRSGHIYHTGFRHGGNDPVSAMLRDLASAMTLPFATAMDQLRQVFDQFRDAGVVPAQPPDDPRARALWLRQHRNTGPSRDVVHQRRPRRHPGQ